MKIALRPGKYFNILVLYNWILSLFSISPERLSTYLKFNVLSILYCISMPENNGLFLSRVEGGFYGRHLLCSWDVFPSFFLLLSYLAAQEVRLGAWEGQGEAGMCSPKPLPQTRLPKLKQPHRELRKL